MSKSSNIGRQTSRLLAFALLAATPLLGAEVPVADKLAAEERVGMQAEKSERYADAVKHYRRAVELATGDLAEKRGDLLLKLAQAQLLVPDVEGALQTLEEFSRIAPGKANGFLQGAESLPSAGWISRIFSGDAPERRALALCLLGETAIVRGDYEAAEVVLGEVSKLQLPTYNVRAQLALAYIYIQRGDFRKAQDVLTALRSTPEALAGYQFRHWTLVLLLEASQGEEQKFSAAWEEFRRLYSPTADPIVATALSRVGDRLVKSNQAVAAEKLFTEAFYWQISDADRQDILQQLFSIQIGNPEMYSGAARTAEKYDELFPDGPDRWDFLFRAAHEMQLSGKFAEAVRLCRRIVDADKAPIAERLNAMREAAKAAESQPDYPTATQMYKLLLSNQQYSQNVVGDRVDFGGFLYRIGQYAAAVETLSTLPDSEEAQKVMLEARIKLQDWAEAEKIADRLIRSASAPTVGFARFRAAEIAENRGDLLDAREKFLALEKADPAGELAAMAAFRAAYLAWRANLELATAELEDYAERYPKAKNAPTVLFLAMQSKPDLASAKKLFEQLVERYPQAAVVPGAVRQLAEYMIRADQPTEFFALLEKYQHYFVTEAEVAELALTRFRGMAEFGQTKLVAEEAAPGGVLSARYAGTPVAGEIAFLAGNCYSTLERYPEALTCYERAAELHPHGILGACARGRIGVISLTLFFSSRDPKKLEVAGQIFQNLIDDPSTDPDLRLEGFYQLARCRKAADDWNGALELYAKTLEYANELRQEGTAPEPVWCAKAIKEALTLMSISRFPNHLSRGQKLINLFEALGWAEQDEELTAVKAQFFDEKSNGK